MHLFRSLLTLFLACAIGFCFCADTHAAPTEARADPPAVSAKGAILIDAEDGTVYFEQNADTPSGPASTTKLMTALVVSELCDPDTVVTIPPEAVGIEGSSIYLIAGEKLTVQELLYALLLSSANDAATALAIAASGSIEAFCAQMNEKAKQLGLKRTHFENPHGLSHELHVTTARELATVAREVLRTPLLRQIVATYKHTIPHDGIPDRRLLVNHNKLLRSYEGAIGMKTGFTKSTGRTLVSAAERNGLTLIAVTLNAPDDWQDHRAMLDYGFGSYEKVTLVQAGEFRMPMPICGGEHASVTLTNSEPITLTLPRGDRAPSYTVESVSRFLFCSVKQGDSIGTLTVTCEGKTAVSPLIAERSVTSSTEQKRSPLHRLLHFFKLE